jgi:hypothetical protein
MKNLKLTKIMASTLLVASLFALNPIGASASWRQDSNGWWNTEGSSWSVGWRNIDSKWYYFNSNGYMGHDITINGYKLGSDGAWIQNNTVNNDGYNQNIITTKLASLVTAGTITADDQTAIETALTSTNGNFKTALDGLVTAGTITSDQETSIETALSSRTGFNTNTLNNTGSDNNGNFQNEEQRHNWYNN